jgi:hypothetical protein
MSIGDGSDYYTVIEQAKTDKIELAEFNDHGSSVHFSRA